MPGCLSESVSVSLWAELYEELRDNYARPNGFMLMILSCEGLRSGSDSRFIWEKVSRGLQLGKKVESDFLIILSRVFFPLIILTEDYYTFSISVPWEDLKFYRCKS